MNIRIGLWAYLDRYWIDEKIIISQKLDMKPDFVFKSVQNVKYSVIGFGSLFDGGQGTGSDERKCTYSVFKQSILNFTIFS